MEKSEFLELCRRRRSIRKFTDEAVEQEIIDMILQCALMSPSGKRINPWQFYVVQDRGLLQQMAACKSFGSQMLRTATAAIVVALDAAATDTWQCDGAIAAQNILLAAEDLGLGACWCQVYQREQAEQTVKQLCGVDDALTVLCVIALGHKSEQRQLYDLDKLPYDKIKRV